MSINCCSPCKAVQHAGYHAYWASERSKNSGKKSFNPALVGKAMQCLLKQSFENCDLQKRLKLEVCFSGWDFTNPSDPREVQSSEMAFY